MYPDWPNGHYKSCMISFFVFLSYAMKKRYFLKKKLKAKGKDRRTLPVMRPGTDAGLESIFQKIGVPEKQKFVPDQFQTQALKAVKDADCLVTAPTGAGKTWIAENAAKRVAAANGRIWYATPLKALTNSIYAGFVKIFGESKVGILTGDIKENADAAIVIGTTEILRNQLYDAMHTGKDLGCSLVILDEAHYLGDVERGVVWEEILIYLPVRIPLLMLSATIGNSRHLSGWLESIRGKKCHIIEETKRPVPLFPVFFHPSGTLYPLVQKSGSKFILNKKVASFLKTKHPLKIALPGRLPQFSEIMKILKDFRLLPAIFFLKSRSDCDQAIRLCSPELLADQKERKIRLRSRVDELVSKTPHLANHIQRKYLELMAVGSHHSGQLPAWKVIVETLMSEGLLDAMFATSTVAAGVNFPARSVVILNSDRFNGTEFMPLTASEFQQMTGRAGRRGMDKIGFAIVLPGKFMDLKYAAKMLHAPARDIESQIRINFSMVLNLLLSHNPQQIRLLLKKSFASYMVSKGKKGKYARKAYGNNMEYLWEDFIAHLDFLQGHGFVKENGILTEDGEWAARLRIDSPLMVAHCLRKKLLPENDPVLLAAVMASFVNEKEFDNDRISGQIIFKTLNRLFLKLRKGLTPFAQELLKKGFDAPQLYIQPAVIIFLWAGDAPWDVVVQQSPFAEGDLARLILRTAENLRQLANLTETFAAIAETAVRAIDLLLREPVVTYHD